MSLPDISASCHLAVINIRKGSRTQGYLQRGYGLFRVKGALKTVMPLSRRGRGSGWTPRPCFDCGSRTIRRKAQCYNVLKLAGNPRIALRASRPKGGLGIEGRRWSVRRGYRRYSTSRLMAHQTSAASNQPPVRPRVGFRHQQRWSRGLACGGACRRPRARINRRSGARARGPARRDRSSRRGRCASDGRWRRDCGRDPSHST